MVYIKIIYSSNHKILIEAYFYRVRDESLSYVRWVRTAKGIKKTENEFGCRRELKYLRDFIDEVDYHQGEK